MLQYTKATLKASLALWVEGNGLSADEDFTDSLDEIIQRGEVRAMRDLDLSLFDYVSDTITTSLSGEVFKPESLITEALLVVSVDGVKTQLTKKNRAFVDAMLTQDATGTPRYYCERTEDTWLFAPIPPASYAVYVHGQYRAYSIVDGSDDNTTWLSTRLPDILWAACAIEAAHELKNWARKSIEEADYNSKLDNARAMTTNLRRADVAEIIGANVTQRQPTVPPDPSAT